MDWARAIEINRAALTRIVAALVSLLAAQGESLRLPLPVYQALARVLHPAESAVRRLIVMIAFGAARGLAVPAFRSRPMPKGLVIERKALGRVSFQLFDTRKHFDDPDDAAIPISGPRIRSVGEPSPRELFLAQFVRPPDGFSSAAETERVRRRLEVLRSALDHLPREAKRMARWMKRRALMKNPPFISPLRPGPPPGRRSRPGHDIDLVLTECHALACHALAPDTS